SRSGTGGLGASADISRRMLESGVYGVKQGSAPGLDGSATARRRSPTRPADLPRAVPARQTGRLISLPFSVNALAMLVTGAALVAVSVLLGLAYALRRGNRRRREVRQLLDAADALEAR